MFILQTLFSNLVYFSNLNCKPCIFWKPYLQTLFILHTLFASLVTCLSKPFLQTLLLVQTFSVNLVICPKTFSANLATCPNLFCKPCYLEVWTNFCPNFFCKPCLLSKSYLQTLFTLQTTLSVNLICKPIVTYPNLIFKPYYLYEWRCWNNVASLS